jgi:hypothetical protein
MLPTLSTNSTGGQPDPLRPTRGPDGFRLARRETTRLEGFSDAVFGFALTLLVVSLDAPRNFDALLDDLRGFLAFGICFALFLQLWHQHHVWSRRYALDDAGTVALNGALLFVLLAYVYPLRFLFTVVTGQVTGMIPAAFLAGGPVIRQEQVPQLMYLYGAGFAAVELLFAALFARALGRRAALGLDEVEVHETRASVLVHLLLAGVGGLSILITARGGSAFWAGNAYFLIGPVVGITKTVTARQRRALVRQVDDWPLVATGA